MAVAEIKAGSFALNYDAGASGTAENDIRSGSTKLYGVLVDNSGLASIVFIKFHDSTTPVEGTDEPYMAIAIAASTKRWIPIYPGSGLTFATALSYLVTTVDANGSAQTDPGTLPPVTLLTDA